MLSRFRIIITYNQPVDVLVSVQLGECVGVCTKHYDHNPAIVESTRRQQSAEAFWTIRVVV